MNLRRFPATREISIGVLFYLYLPVLVLIIYSFNGNRTATIWTEASLHWYGRILENPSIRAATWNSLVLAFSAGIGATLIALLAALATKNHFRGIGGLDLAALSREGNLAHLGFLSPLALSLIDSAAGGVSQLARPALLAELRAEYVGGGAAA